MKHTLLLAGMLFLITGCLNKSYFEVMSTNQNRFEGWEFENAVFLNESYDLILLVEAMSTNAETRSTLKENYQLATHTKASIEDLHPKFKRESIRLRVKLTSKLSQTNEDYLHQFDDFTNENFDKMYVKCMRTKLSELDIKMNAYTSTGKTELMGELADDVQDSFRPLNESLAIMN